MKEGEIKEWGREKRRGEKKKERRGENEED